MESKKGRVFAMGDIHGAHKALLQCLERAGFNKETDTLIQLGDVADGWSEVYECVEELLKIPNLISIKGNHDDWALTWMVTGQHTGAEEGGKATVQSYINHSQESQGYGESMIHIDERHLKFFRTQHHYYKDDNDRVFVHGGFNRHLLLRDQALARIFWWDRDLWHTALSYQAMNKGLITQGGNKVNHKIVEPVTEVFIGHTSTVMWRTDEPMKAAKIWNLDTGAGSDGKLTIMNVDTHEYWQSDRVMDLYPDEYRRRIND